MCAAVPEITITSIIYIHFFILEALVLLSTGIHHCCGVRENEEKPL